MNGKKYLTLDQYDGSLGGIETNNFYPHQFPTEGGVSSIYNHWSHGLFGKPEQITDAYAGTGDRYISGEYGNMYKPDSHGNTYDNYRGPHSDKTETTTISGTPYFWNQKKSSTDNIESFSNIEILEPLTSNEIKTIKTMESGGLNISSLKIIVVVILIVVGLNLWSETIHYYIQQSLNSSGKLTWVRLAIYATIATIVATLFIKISNSDPRGIFII